MTLLADLKSDQETSLDESLLERKHALSQLRRLSIKRGSLAEELRAREEDDFSRQLKELDDEYGKVCDKISAMEEELRKLHQRRQSLEVRIENIGSRREADLSSFRGALKDVDARMSALLSRPPVVPLDVEAYRSDAKGKAPEGGAGGLEFMQMRADRRTAEMAKAWWEGEVGLLEQRKAAVVQERAVLTEGAEVWAAVVELVTGFERDLEKSLSGGGSSASSPDAGLSLTEKVELMLEKLSGVVAGVEQRLETVEERKWNLLIVAIGAELAACKEGELRLRELIGLPIEEAKEEGKEALVNVEDDKGGDSDNEVPADLLIGVDSSSPPDEEAGSDSEVPPALLAEKEQDEDDGK
jgi:DNA repair exonuclease SbcCD ATPase subunit